MKLSRLVIKDKNVAKTSNKTNDGDNNGANEI